MLLGRRSAHPPAGAVGAGAEALRVALAPDDIAAGTHAAGDDAEIPLSCSDRALAGDPDVGPVMVFLSDIVVVTVDDLGGDPERRQMPVQGAQHQFQHRLPVLHRVILRPVHGFDVIIEVLRAFGEIGQIPIRQLNHPTLHVLARQLDEIVGHGIADAPTAGMQHDPDLAGLVQTDLDEMVAAAQGAHLVRPFGELAEGFQQLRMAPGQRFQSGLERTHGLGQYPIIGMLAATDGHIPADLVEDFLEGLFIEVVSRDRQACRHHAAADIDAHGRRNDGLARGDDRADGGADAEMDIGHGGDMMMDKGQAGDIAQLLLRLLVDVIRPDFDGNALAREGLFDRHGDLAVVYERVRGSAFTTSGQASCSMPAM